MTATFTAQALTLLKRIPRGRVVTYGQIAALAGNHRGARQISRLLHSSSDKHRLPWHRVINNQGRISLRPGTGYELQRALLEAEGVEFDIRGGVDLKRFQWRPRAVPARIGEAPRPKRRGGPQSPRRSASA